MKVLRGVLDELVERDARVAEGGYHQAAHGLLQRGVRRGEAADRLDRRVREQRRLDLRRDDGLAAAVDGLLGARDHEEVALVVDVAVVARVEPTVGELGAVAALVALHHGRALERDVPDLATRQLGTLGGVDLELRPQLPARRAGALQVVVVRRRGDGHALGHAIARHEDAPPARGRVGLAHLDCERGRQWRGGVGDEAQPVRHRLSVEGVEDGLVDGRARVVPRALVRGHVGEEPVGVEVGHRHDRAARDDG